MAGKVLLRLALDGGLALTVCALFAYHLYEESTHEWLGLVFALTAGVHLYAGRWWIKRLRTGRYDAHRIVGTSVSALAFALLCTALVSGILLSKHLFADMPFHMTGDGVRKVHMSATHWLQIVIGVHIGLHWHTVASMLANRLCIDTAHVLARRVIPLCWIIIAAHGVWAFWRRGMLPYLFLQVDFAHFEFGEHPVYFYTDFIAILTAVAVITRYGIKRLPPAGRRT